MQIRKIVFLFIVVWEVNISSCDMITDQTDAASNTMSVMLGDSLYQLSNVDGFAYMSERSYEGTIAGKTLFIETYQSSWKNDTCSFSIYEAGSDSNSYIRYGNDYNAPRYGKIIRTGISNRRETGTFYFDIISGNDTLHFRDGKYNIYIKPGK